MISINEFLLKEISYNKKITDFNESIAQYGLGAGAIIGGSLVFGKIRKKIAENKKKLSLDKEEIKHNDPFEEPEEQHHPIENDREFAFEKFKRS